MDFLAPWNLLVLAVLPLLVLIYLHLVRGRSESHVHYPDAGLMALGMPKPGWQQLPSLLFLTALAIAIVALARPTVLLLAPQSLSGVVVAMETGFSMRNSDIFPNRMTAAKASAKALVRALPANIPVALVTFSNFGELNVPLTLEHDKVLQGIDFLDMGNGYSFSYGLLKGLEALPETLPQGVSPGVIVLYAHGHDVSGNDPRQIAARALKRGIHIYTVGVGTHGNNFSEDILQVIARQTQGKYYPIYNTRELSDVHLDLSRVIGYRPQPTEASGLMALAAALLLAFSLLLSELRRRVI